MGIAVFAKATHSTSNAIRHKSYNKTWRERRNIPCPRGEGGQLGSAEVNEVGIGLDHVAGNP